MNSFLLNKLAYAIGLAVDCPLEQALDSCILTDTRRESLQTRFMMMKQMNESQLDAIIRHHHDCFENRTGATLHYS